jgi:hypothetical protein
MLIKRKDTFLNDILLLLLISVVCSALFAVGFATVTDKYFAKAVTGVMGDFGQYDLLFQTREELKGALVRQIRQVIEERFPGATLKSGISLAGKSTFFLTLPSQYKNKTTFNNLSYYFDNLPGNGGYAVMTEPRLDISSVPAGVFDLMSRQVEQIPGVSFVFNDGGCIGVVLKDTHASETVLQKIKELLSKYQILEVRLNTGTSREEIVTLGKKVSQSLIGIKGVDYAQDISMTGGMDDNQYLMNTLLEVKKFLLAYAAEVSIQPNPGQSLEVGDLLVLNGQNSANIKPGALLEPLEVVVKVSSKDASGVHGLIIQGDAGFLRDNIAYKMLERDKIGSRVGTIEVSSRKNQLVYGMDQGVKLLTRLNAAITDFNNTTGGPGLTVTGVEKVYGQLSDIKGSLKSVESSITGLTGKANQASLTRMVRLIDGVGDDLDYLAKTFGRVQILENRFNQTFQGLQDARILTGSPLLQGSIGQAGGISDKMQLLNSQLSTVENVLQSRIRQLDDFINRFNPLVSVLLSWRNKAKDLAATADNFGAVFTPGSANHQKLISLMNSTDQVISGITGFNLPNMKSGLNIISDRLFGSDKIDLSALIAELERVKDSLPKLLDEEIGHSVSLIDKYAGGETGSGEKIQIFTRANVDRQLIDATIRDVMNNDQVTVFSLPVGAIQPDIRGELFKILAEVRSTIAALIVISLWVLTFILDQSLIISMFKQMEISLLPAKLQLGNPWLNGGYRILKKILSPANLYAGIIGGVWLGTTFALAGARIPYLNYWEIGMIGSLLGVLIASLAEKVNPISKEEVQAGLSLGLSFKTIMREIVIPAGRPGIMQFLNRWKMVMK